MVLPQRKRVKVEEEAEDVSTVTTGKVIVSAMGAARIVRRADQQKTRDKNRKKRTIPKDDSTVRKKKSTAKIPHSSRIARKTPNEAATQKLQTVDKTQTEQTKTVKRRLSQQPLKKKKRLV